jgi:CoB--CoM heterodisulfide reductase subunit B
MKEFAVFWGCTIQTRFPFLEKSTRMVMDAYALPYKEVDGFTCCPEKSLVNNLDPGLWTLTAARNIAVAEDEGVDVVSPCTGCISNLATVKSELKTSPKEKAEVNELLGKIDREFTGEATLSHLIPFFHDKVTIKRMKEKVKKNFEGLKVAIHYGCHMMRPAQALKADDPISPKKFDALVEALGAESINHRTKLTCCGQGLDRVNQHDNALQLARAKLRELKSLGADAMILCCPSCFLQFDNNQYLLEKEGEKYSIPVIYFTELLGLAMGYSAEELGLNSHRVDVTPFIEKWESITEQGEEAAIIEEGLNASGIFGL